MMKKRANPSKNPISIPGDRAAGSVPKEWQLQDAKARFSEAFRSAREAGPQRITRYGREAVVIIREEDNERLSKAEASQRSLVKFFADSALSSSERDLGRPIDL